jgi:hypothetical protein
LIHWVEETQIQSSGFLLPGKKELLKSDAEYEAILVDATKTPVERPNRGNSAGIPGRKSGIR